MSDVEGALALLREAAKKDANLPPAQVLMSQLYLQQGMLAPARKALECAVVEDPADPAAYVMLGQLAVRDGRVTEAELILRKADSLLSTYDKSAKQKSRLQLEICSGLASVAEDRENWEEAQKQLEALLKLDPGNAATLQRLARCLVRQKKPAEALEELKKAAKIDAAMLAPEAVLANFCEEAGDRENAKKYMEAALAAAPKDPRTRLVAARWAFDIGQMDDALIQVNAALKLDPKMLEAKILRGIIAAFQKDYRTAEHYFEDAKLQSPDSFQATNDLALALVEQKDDTKKRLRCNMPKRTCGSSRSRSTSCSTYGWVLYKTGHLEEAINALCAAITGAAFNPETAYYLAQVDADRGQAIEARLLLERALKETGPFAMRPEATALLEKLNKEQYNKE